MGVEPILTGGKLTPQASEDHEQPLHSVVLTRSSVFPPVGGVALRVAGNVEALRRLGPVTLLTVATGGSSFEPFDGVTVCGFTQHPRGSRQRVTDGLRGLHPHRHPATSALRLPEAVSALRSIVANSERRGLVVLEEVWMAAYLQIARASSWPVVYDAHNVESTLRRADAFRTPDGVRRLRAPWLRRQLSAVETRLARSVDQVWACGEPDRQLLARLRGGAADIQVVPNTVRTQRASSLRACPRPAGMGSGRTVVYPAMFGYPPNEEAALLLIEEILPRLREQRQDVRLILVGRHPTDAMRGAVGDRDDILITGEVEDVQPWLEHADVVAVPLLSGGGTRLKILEAFAAGAPVVTTSKGAEGLMVVDGKHAAVRDDLSGFAAEVNRVLDDPQLAASLRREAHALVDECYSWEAAAGLVEQSVRQLGLLAP